MAGRELRLVLSYCVMCVHKPRNTSADMFMFASHLGTSNLERCARAYKYKVESRQALCAQFISFSASRHKPHELLLDSLRAAAEHHRHAVNVAVDLDNEGAYNTGIQCRRDNDLVRVMHV